MLGVSFIFGVIGLKSYTFGNTVIQAVWKKTGYVHLL